MSQLSLLGHTLDDLDELGEIMTEMLQTQESVEVCAFPATLPLSHRGFWNVFRRNVKRNSTAYITISSHLSTCTTDSSPTKRHTTNLFLNSQDEGSTARPLRTSCAGW